MTPAENLQLEKADFKRNLRKKVMKFEDMGDIASSVDKFSKRPIVKGIIYWGETSAWIAPPGGLKTALLNSLALHVSSGRDWHGYKTKQRVGVIYFALERADLVRRRLIAQARQLGIDPKSLNIIVVSEMIDLINPAMVDRVSELIDATRHLFDPPADAEDQPEYVMGTGLVIFDTFAKLIAAGGGDEDKAKDQGRVFANLQRIKNQHGCHVALIGHTGKDESRGSRGSNAIVGDVDMMVTISGDDIKTATVIKANDAPEGPLFSFKSEVFDFGPDDDGDPITVNIVSDEPTNPAKPTNREPKLTANQRTLFAMLHDAGAAGLSLEEWNNQARDAGIGVKRKADLNDIRSALLSKLLVRQYGDRWTARHA